MPDKIVHTIHLDRYAPMPAQIQLGTVESYGVEQIAVVAGAGWDGLDIVAVYHPPKAAEPVRVLVPSDGLSDVPPEATASAGRGALVIAGMADGVQIASCNIAYTVIAQAGTDGTTSDAPTPDLVQQILSAANGAVKTADGVRADMDKVLEAESGRKTAEADRAAAESERVTAETARAEAEADRAAAEKERQTAESARIAAENDRQSAETARAKVETARESAETDRATAESARVKAEEERADDERLRKERETQRVTDETARQTAESKRQEAEIARADAESKRADAEQSRVEAESTRVAAETARKDAESKRASAEQERQTAESTRVEAEAEREKQLPAIQTAVDKLKEDVGEKGTALTDIQKKMSDSKSNDGFLLCDLNGNIVGHIASFAVWNNEPYNKKYGWGGHPYGNGKLPPYSRIVGVLEADLLSVRGGKGRWNKDDTGNFQHGGHLFEGWNAEEDARLTFGIGTKSKDISWIQTFHAATQEGTDSGAYYCVTKVGSDIDNQGMNFMPSITQSRSLFSLKVGNNLSPNSKHIQKLVETGELVDWEYNKTDMIPYGTMYFDYNKDKVRVYTRTGGWKYLKFEEEV